MPYTQTTLASLRTQLQAKFESVPFFTVVEQDAAINEALQWYNLYTGVWKLRVVATTAANQVYYPLTGTLIYNARVEFNGKSLNQSSLTDMDNGRPGWEAETTATGGTVPTQPFCWVPVGLTLLALWPADAAGNNGLLIDGVHATPVLVSATDTLDLDAADIDDIVGEALFILCFKDPGRFPKVIQWHAEFLKTVLLRNARLRNSNAFRHTQGTDLARQTHPINIVAD